MDENEIAREIVNAAYQIHRKLGPGLLESVYETVSAFDLEKTGLNVERQVPVMDGQYRGGKQAFC